MADKREHFLKLGAAVGAEELKTTFEAMSPLGKATDIINRQNPGGGAKTFAELTPEERIELRSSNPAEYAALYKTEYGIDLKQ
jgi:hypothetical protein